MRIFQKVGRGHGVQFFFAMTPFDDKCQNLQNNPAHCCAGSHRFRDINILNLLPSKRRSRPQCTIFAMPTFKGKCQNLQESAIHFPLALTVSYICKKITLKNQVKVTEYNFHNETMINEFKWS